MTTDTVTLEFTREVTKEQMALLRTLAFLNDKKLADYLWECIASYALSDVDAKMFSPSAYDKYERLLSC